MDSSHSGTERKGTPSEPLVLGRRMETLRKAKGNDFSAQKCTDAKEEKKILQKCKAAKKNLHKRYRKAREKQQYAKKNHGETNGRGHGRAKMQEVKQECNKKMQEWRT